MTEDADEQRRKALDDHYQPWLRNQPGGQPPAPPVSRPQPLPTRTVGATPDQPPVFDSMATQQQQRPAAMSADELLARPIPMPPAQPDGPGTVQQVGQSVAGAVSRAVDKTVSSVRAADIPGKIAKLEIGRRSREAASSTARLIGKGASSAGDAAKTAAEATSKAASRMGDAAGPKIKAAADAAREGLSKGASAASAGIGGAARKVADVAPIPGVSGKADALPESQLERLLEQEQATPKPIKPVPSLPLFAEALPTTPDSVAQPITPAAPVDAPMAAAPPVASIPQPSAAQQTPPPPSAATSPSRVTGPGGSGGTSGSGGSGGSGGPVQPGSIKDWSRHPATWVLGGLALLATGFAGGAMWGGAGINREATERTIHDYLLNNPAIIPQAMEKLQSDRQAEAVNRLRDRIERPFSGAWAGAASGDVTLVVFTDYACTFCRASLPDIDRLLREDRRLKVVFRELPILSRDSEAAARLALVAARRGKYMPMHQALFASGNPDSAVRVDAAEDLAVPAGNDALNDPAITAELESNFAMARELGFDGTPSWVVGDKMLTGAVGYDQLRAAVAAARAE